MEGISVPMLLLMHEVRRCLVQPDEGSLETSGAMLLDSLVHLAQLLKWIWMVLSRLRLPHIHVDMEMSL